MLEEANITDLRDIMTNIQALVLTVALLQIASSRQQKGLQNRGRPRQRHALSNQQSPGAASIAQPPPDNLGRQLQQAAPDILVAFGALDIEYPCLGTFPALSTLPKDNQETSPRSRLEIIATLPLTERPLLLIFLASPEPHI